jgi:hypothetical protein
MGGTSHPPATNTVAASLAHRRHQLLLTSVNDNVGVPPADSIAEGSLPERGRQTLPDFARG